MSDELQLPSFLRPEERRRVCMFSIMMERGRRAREFEALGVDTIFSRLGDGRYAETEADMMRGWLGHMAQNDASMDLSERIEQIETRYALGRRRRRRKHRLSGALRMAPPLLLLVVLAITALLVSPDLRTAV